jgi:hypothetical protein
MACSRHPATAERYLCATCEARWCAACVRSVTIAGRLACAACGHAVERTAPTLRAADSVLDAIQRVVSVEAATTAAAFAVFYMLARWVVALGIFYASALVSYYFAIIHHVGDDKDGLPGQSDVTEDWVENLGFAARGVLCAGLGALPLLGWLLVTHDLPHGAGLIALVALGQLYMPAALLAVVFSGAGLAAAWPPAWVRVIARAPAAYVQFVGLWLGSVAVGAALCAVTLALFGDAMLIGAWLAATLWSLYWFAQACLVGNFLRGNAARFGWHS